MNDNEFRDICALMAMQQFLKDDLARLDANHDTKTMGHAWVAKQSFMMADIMVEQRKK